MSQRHKYFNEHFSAIAAAIMLHTGMAAWAMHPSAPVVIKQQVIQVSMVAPSSVEQIEQKKSFSEPIPVMPLKDTGMRKQKKFEKQPEHKAEQKQQKASVAQQASGPQADDAIDKVAARTEPVFDAAYLQNPPPIYPNSARKSGVQGKVVLAVNVSIEGAAREVMVASSSGHSLLDEAALDAVRRWRFVPAKRGTEIIEAKVLVPVEFKLN